MARNSQRSESFDPRPREGGDVVDETTGEPDQDVSIHAPVKEATPYQ